MNTFNETNLEILKNQSAGAKYPFKTAATKPVLQHALGFAVNDTVNFLKEATNIKSVEICIEQNQLDSTLVDITTWYKF